MNTPTSTVQDGLSKLEQQIIAEQNALRARLAVLTPDREKAKQ